MGVDLAVDIGRSSIWMALLVGGPVLVAGMAVGLLVGLLQALTQVQEQTVAFVPKILAMVLVLGLCLPWALTKMLEFSHQLIANIPNTF